MSTLGLCACGLLYAGGKAIALNAELRYCPCQRPGDASIGQDTFIGAREVDVTIGLFTIIKLFRLVNLTVESKGFCLPPECEEITTNPCEFFENLRFPLDIFEPPSQEDVLPGFLGFSERDERGGVARADRKDCCCER